MAKMGRPRKEINQKQFESLCAIQCTIEEVCAVLDVDESTLERWCKEVYDKTFSKVFKEKRQFGKASLRRMQWHLAEKNPSMAIFLGKNMLGQTDKVEQTVLEVEDLSALASMLKVDDDDQEEVEDGQR